MAQYNSVPYDTAMYNGGERQLFLVESSFTISDSKVPIPFLSRNESIFLTDGLQKQMVEKVFPEIIRLNVWCELSKTLTTPPGT